MQSALPPSQSAIGISVLVFCQNIMSSVFITVANTVFQTSLAREVVQLAPSISPAAAAAAGDLDRPARAKMEEDADAVPAAEGTAVTPSPSGVVLSDLRHASRMRSMPARMRSSRCSGEPPG